ncbi:TPA: hypothetical protein SR406_002639 [Staphylococcus aureus]|nr:MULTISPECIES: hypothetical protein [Staphylococcus]KAJ45822.1 hypothetical protein HMPREF1625_04326 [Staphylococcus aureus 880]MBY0989404.1 hypothetical protein [Staphylococcus aureus]MCL7498285.1 hypothetical protein [Staphylococcus aureus]NGQ51174.1 hypothetical protein [Staphylococcus aureus]QEA20375.1 hypothetical protein FSN21_14485 [Staphylococcus aureus]
MKGEKTMRNKNYIGGLTKENLKGFVILVLIFLYVLSALLNLTGFFWGYVFIPVFAIWSIYMMFFRGYFIPVVKIFFIITLTTIKFVFMIFFIMAIASSLSDKKY